MHEFTPGDRVWSTSLRTAGIFRGVKDIEDAPRLYAVVEFPNDSDYPDGRICGFGNLEPAGDR